MRPKHSCGTELSTMRFYDYEEGKTVFANPMTKGNGEWMYCKKCKVAVPVEVKT